MGNLTLEAMRCGVPIICSNTSAFPEITGDDEIMCNPLDHEEITKKLLIYSKIIIIIKKD